MRIFCVKNNIFISDRLVQIHQQESNQPVLIYLVKKTACKFTFAAWTLAICTGTNRELLKKVGNFMAREKIDSGRIEPGREILAQPEASRRPDFYRTT